MPFLLPNQQSQCTEGLERLGLDDIILVLQQNRLQIYGHVLRKEDNDCMNKWCMKWRVSSQVRQGCKKTWREIVEKDCQSCKLNIEDAIDRIGYMMQIRDE